MLVYLVEVVMPREISLSCFFLTVQATTEIYTLSLHDALPIYPHPSLHPAEPARPPLELRDRAVEVGVDRNSTRLNFSHQIISFAVFCLKKKRTICHLVENVC